MIYFKIKNNTKRDVVRHFRQAIKLLKPYFDLIDSKKYPVKVVVLLKEDTKDRSTVLDDKDAMIIKIFEDESKQSDTDIVWLILHEFAHIIQSYNEEIKKTSLSEEDTALRIAFSKLFNMNEDQVVEVFHDFLPSESTANFFATMLIGKFHKRHAFSIPHDFLKNKGI